MNKTDLHDVVHGLLTAEFKVDPDSIKTEASFKDIGLDSLDVVSFVMALEDRLHVEIPESDLEGVERLGDAIDLLARKVAERA